MFEFLKELYSLATEKLLTEMAFERKLALERIGALCLPQACHMVMIEQCKDPRDHDHWAIEINAFLGNIFDHTFLKGHSRIKRNELFILLFEGPLGEYDDYIRRIASVKRKKPGLQLLEPNEQHYNAIKKRYLKALELILSSKIEPPRYEDLG